MAHKKIIDSVKRQGQVAIKDLDEFLRFVINEYDMRTVAENPGLGWKVRDNIIHNCVTIYSFALDVLRIKPYEYLVEGKKNSLFIVPPETFELMYKSDESRKW